MSTCKIEYVMEGVVTTQAARINPDGNVEVIGGLDIHKIRGDSYVWCDTHQVVISSGSTHEGMALADYWETV
jgi:hypothetical protein